MADQITQVYQMLQKVTDNIKQELKNRKLNPDEYCMCNYTYSCSRCDRILQKGSLCLVIK